MAGREHRYTVDVRWTGDRGEGTSTYRSYGRDAEITGAGKPVLPASADPVFRGDATRYNPEELLVAALSQCHMLTFLHLAALSGVVVTGYTDSPEGTMVETADGGGDFTEVVLHPVVRVREVSAGAGAGAGAGAEAAASEAGAGADDAVAVALDDRLAALHSRAHELCFIARSVAFPVRCEPAPAEVAAGE